MAIQIKNKYLKRLLKKTGFFSKKTGGSSNDIKNIIKGGGRECSEDLKTILTERANQLFKMELLKNASESISNSSRSTFGSFSSITPIDLKGKIDTLVHRIDDVNFDSSSESDIGSSSNSSVDSKTPKTKPFTKTVLPITVSSGDNKQQEITLQYYNLKRGSDHDKNALKYGIIKWQNKVYKGSYKMDEGEPFFISGQIIEDDNTSDPTYIFNHQLVTIPKLDLTKVVQSPDAMSLGESERVSQSGSQGLSQPGSERVSQYGSQGLSQPGSKVVSLPGSESRSGSELVSLPGSDYDKLYAQNKELDQQLLQKQSDDIQRMAQIQKPIENPEQQDSISQSTQSGSSDSIYDFDNLHAFQDVQIANAQAKIAEENARLEELKYQQQISRGRRILPPIGSNIVPIDVSQSNAISSSVIPDRSYSSNIAVAGSQGSTNASNISDNDTSIESSHQLIKADNTNCPSQDSNPVACKGKKDYKQQSLIFHPDRNAACQVEAVKKFQELNDLCPNNGEKQQDDSTIGTSVNVSVQDPLLLKNQTVDNSELGSVIAEAVEEALSDNDVDKPITQHDGIAPVDISNKEKTLATVILDGFEKAVSSNVDTKYNFGESVAPASTTYVIEFKAPVIDTKHAKDNISVGEYKLDSTAGNTHYYTSIQKAGSLTDIIDYHVTNPNQKPIQSNVEITHFINSGSYNLVYGTTDPKKVFRILRPSKARDHVSNELYGLIVQYYFTKKCTNYVCEVFDFGTINYNSQTLVYAILQAANFNMFDLFHTSRKINMRDTLTLPAFKQIFKQLYEAITCIHAAGFIHSDVKPENVGIIENNGTFRPILLDFGLTVKNGQSCIGKTPRYVPDNYNSDGRCLQQNDLYAFGMMLLETLFILDKNFGYKNKEYKHFSLKFKKNGEYNKDTLNDILYAYPPSAYYKVLCRNTDHTVEELAACRSFILSLLFSVVDQTQNIDASWLKTSDITSEKSINESNSLSQTIANAIESALKSESSISDSTKVDFNTDRDSKSIDGSIVSDNDDIESVSVDTTDLGNIIATSVASTLDSQTQGLEGSASTFAEGSGSTLISVSESEDELAPALSESEDELAPAVSESEDELAPAVSESVSVSEEESGVSSLVVPVSGEELGEGSVVSSLVVSPTSVSGPSASASGEELGERSAVSASVVPPEFSGGFLLVCPSSMQVVSIFNDSKGKQIFAYDNNMSYNKFISFSKGTLDMFIKKIDEFIDAPMVCKESIDTNTDALTTLFANGFMNGLLSKSSNTDKDTLTTLFANGFIRALQPVAQAPSV
jgi:serine/threonine protein kinase